MTGAAFCCALLVHCCCRCMTGAAFGLLLSRFLRQRNGKSVFRIHMFAAASGSEAPWYVKELVTKIRLACPTHDVQTASKNSAFNEIRKDQILVSYGPRPAPLTNVICQFGVRQGTNCWSFCCCYLTDSISHRSGWCDNRKPHVCKKDTAGSSTIFCGNKT